MKSWTMSAEELEGFVGWWNAIVLRAIRVNPNFLQDSVTKQWIFNIKIEATSKGFLNHVEKFRAVLGSWILKNSMENKGRGSFLKQTREHCSVHRNQQAVRMVCSCFVSSDSVYFFERCTSRKHKQREQDNRIRCTMSQRPSGGLAAGEGWWEFISAWYWERAVSDL